MAEQNDQVMRLQEAYANAYNEITQPDKVFVATQYFRKKWVPRLGPALSWLIIALRQHCYWNRQTGEKRDWCLVTQEELAEEIGVTPKTVRRLLQHEHAGRFIVEVENRYRYDNQLGKLVRKHSFYRIRMDDPLIPEDEELLRQRLADELAGLRVDPETGQRDMLKLLDRMINRGPDELASADEENGEDDLPDKMSPRSGPGVPPQDPESKGPVQGPDNQSNPAPAEESSEFKDSHDPASGPDPHPDLPDKMSPRRRPELVEGSGDEGDLPDKMSARSGHLADKMPPRSGDLPDKMSGILYTGQNDRNIYSTITVPNSPEKVRQQQQYTPAAPVVVVDPDKLEDLTLTNDQVLVPVYVDSDAGTCADPGRDKGEQELFSVQSIVEVVKEDIRRAGRYDRDIGFLNRREVYYSVEHALGQGEDEWTEEEERKIGERHRLERELGERFNRLGAFSLEEALQQYFSPEFTAEILKDRSPSELERIEGWVAYIRQQKNLTNPAGFLRTKIESGETAPHDGKGKMEGGLHSPSSNLQSPISNLRSLSSPLHSPSSDLEVPGTDMTSRELWKAALGELQLQMPRATFDTWLKSTHIVRIEEDRFTIACANPYAKDWLQERLNPKITRTLAGLLGRPVELSFEIINQADVS